MSALQWSLLILSVIIVATLVAVNFREKRSSRDRRSAEESRPARWSGARDVPPAQRPAGPLSRSAPQLRGEDPANEQMDIFGAPAAAEEAEAPMPDTQDNPAFLPRGGRAAMSPPDDEPELEPAPPPAPAAAPIRGAGRAEPTAPSKPLLDNGGQYDEFGVGRPRKRQAPTLGGDSGAPASVPTERPSVATPTHAFLRQPSSAAASPAPAAPEPPTPAFIRAPEPPRPAPAPKPAPPAMPEKIISLLIAEREGAPILGPKLHRALSAQGLVFGQRQIYHRMNGDRAVFSVASLVKPGVLIPEQAEGFSTPGLSMFLMLPGPTKPVIALQDMIDTAQSLGRALNAEIYDGKKLPLSAEAIRAMLQEVEDWAKAARV